jgi:hypothetical protein
MRGATTIYVKSGCEQKCIIRFIVSCRTHQLVSNRSNIITYFDGMKIKRDCRHMWLTWRNNVTLVSPHVAGLA